VYQFYNKLCKDPDLDTFAVLKDRKQNQSILSNYDRDDFAEIYLFFDYDGHATNANDDTILDLVQFFDEETEAGKIYISYPMVEALKHLSPSIDFENLRVPTTTNTSYKSMVSRDSVDYLKDLSSLTEDNWKELIEAHLKKMNVIVNDTFSLPSSIISQLEVFKNQKSKFIDIDSTVSVLSPFPIFIFDYYGHNRIKNILES
jgi:hypothetical protein